MILVDFSAILHQCIFGAVSAVKPVENSEGKYDTADFMNAALYFTLKNLIDVENSYHDRYGDLVICLDDKSGTNWRKGFLKSYKSSRKKNRDASKINYAEVFQIVDEFIDVLKEATPWKVVKCYHAEGDDIVLCLCEHFAPKGEKILIISSDKDMLQATKFGHVMQYSLLTKKFITFETKGEDTLDEWLMDHVVLGDACDEVPRIVDETKFSPEFAEFLDSVQLGDKVTPWAFWNDMSESSRMRLTDMFAQKHPDKPVFLKERFGPSALRKCIQKYGSLEKWLASDPLLQQHYERNRNLVLAECIPKYIKDGTINAYLSAESEYDDGKFNTFLMKYKCDGLISSLPKSFKSTLTADFFK